MSVKTVFRDHVWKLLFLAPLGWYLVFLTELLIWKSATFEAFWMIASLWIAGLVIVARYWNTVAAKRKILVPAFVLIVIFTGSLFFVTAPALKIHWEVTQTFRSEGKVIANPQPFVNVSGIVDSLSNMSPLRIDFVNKGTGKIYTAAVMPLSQNVTEGRYSVVLPNPSEYDVIVGWLGSHGISGTCNSVPFALNQSQASRSYNVTCEVG